MKTKSIALMLVFTMLFSFGFTNNVFADNEIQSVQKVEKKLHQSQTDVWIGGVCGGIAEYFGIDSTWVRAGFAFFSLLGGSGALVYVVLWIIMPSA